MISIDTIVQQLVTLNLTGFKDSLLYQTNDANYSSLSFEERLYHLFEAEIIQRDNKRIKRVLQAATLKDKTASLDQIEYLPKRNLDKSVIMSLATGNFIKNNQSVLITGPSGVGKSFTMQCLARRAIDLGYTCQSFIGSCAVIIIEPLNTLSSIISNRSFTSSDLKADTPKSSSSKSLNFEIFAKVFV